MINPNFNVLVLILPSIIFLGINIFVLFHSKNRSSFLFLGIAFSLALYTLSHMFELISSEPEQLLWLARLKYLSFIMVPVFWILLAINRKIHFLPAGLLFLIPAGVFILLWSPLFHEYLSQSVSTELTDSNHVFSFKQGIVYWIYNGFFLCCFIGSAAWTFIGRREITDSDKPGYTLFQLAVFLPIIPAGLMIFLPSVVRLFHLIPLIFSVASILIAVALYHFELFRVSPLARMRLIETLKDPFLVVNMHHFIIDANLEFEKLYGSTDSKKRLIGSNAFEIYRKINLTHEIRRQSFDTAVDFEFQDKHFELQSFPVLKGRRMKGIIHYFHDNTNRKNYEQQLRLSLLRLEKLNDLSRVLSMWMGKGDMTGIAIETATELLNSYFGALYFLESGGLKERARAGMKNEFSRTSPLTALCEDAAFEAITTAGTISFDKAPYKFLSVPLNAEILHGQPGAIVFIKNGDSEFSNFDKSIAESVARQLAVTVENARLYREVERRAQIDGLTGMFTRRHFESLARHEYSYALRHKKPFCIIMSDIDHFKNVNDTHGHPAGDAVLRQVAERLRVNIREADILGRYGGEEFIILLPATEQNTAWNVGKRVHAAIRSKTVSIGTGELEITASFGFSEYNNEKDKSLETVIKRADTALYEAKNTGRNRICFKEA